MHPQLLHKYHKKVSDKQYFLNNYSLLKGTKQNKRLPDQSAIFQTEEQAIREWIIWASNASKKNFIFDMVLGCYLQFSSYYFENDIGQAIIINGEHHRSMNTNWFWPEMHDQDTNDMWFQQDGAMCYTAHATMNILNQQLKSVVISRRNYVNCPQI